jgi:hypothetical protein
MLVRYGKRDEVSMKVMKKEREINSLENILNISCLENKPLDKRAVVGDVVPAGQKVNHESG